MPLAVIAAPLTLLALALPFLFSFAQAPISNFWPLLASWGCGAALALLAVARAAGGPGRAQDEFDGRARANHAMVPAAPLAHGLLLASLLAGVIGLLQYFWGDPALPGVQPSTLGQAIGNLRQRNQQATLLSLGAWALLWSLAQWQRRSHVTGEAGGPLALQHRQMALTVLAGGAMALLAVSSAATASRTGALQWLMVAGMALLWRSRRWRLPLCLVGCGVLVYGLAAWALPRLLLHWTGAATDGLFMRLLGDEHACASRSVLWANVLQLIAQKPWAGWGWGELDYAHYITLFPGERFCALLDNAHNLPLHIAVELGVPVALGFCLVLGIWVWKEKPWQEADPARQLAWGILALVGLHSLLEFPLWYGPFQLVTLLAVLLLWRGGPLRWVALRWARGAAVAAIAAALALGAYAGWDFYRVGLLYKPLAERPLSLRNDTVRKVGGTPFFADQVDFALLTTLELTRANAGQVHAVATKLLHFSPEPRVIEPLIESAVMLGLDDEAAFHLKRYRAAFPKEYARWRARGGPADSEPSP